MTEARPADQQGNEERNLAILAHVLGIFLGFIGPLVIYFLAKEQSSKEHAKVALNWQISLVIYFFVAMLLTLILIGFFVMIVLVIINIIFCVLAAMKAFEGIVWKYPMSITILK